MEEKNSGKRENDAARLQISGERHTLLLAVSTTLRHRKRERERKRAKKHQREEARPLPCLMAQVSRYRGADLYARGLVYYKRGKQKQTQSRRLYIETTRF